MSAIPSWDETQPLAPPAARVPTWDETEPHNSGLESIAPSLWNESKLKDSGIEVISPPMGGPPNPTGRLGPKEIAYWKAHGDMPEEGAEVPPEQRLLNNVNALGAGYALAETPLSLWRAGKAVGRLAGLGKASAELGQAATPAIEAAETAPALEAAAPLAKELPSPSIETIPLPRERIPVRVSRSLPPETPAAGAAAPAPNVPPTPGPSAAETPTPSPADPLAEVKDFVNRKYQDAAQKPGWPERVAKYLQEESRKLGGKDIGLQPGQVKSMGPGFEGEEKAEKLIDYAREQGYFKPGLSDIARKEQIKTMLTKSGRQIDALREMADGRGAPPVENIIQQVKAQLTDKYGIDAPAEVQKVLQKLEKAKPTFSGLSDLATDLNKSKTNMAKLGQHPGPTTDAANIISRINNDAIRGVLNPQEQQLYTTSLRDFGAHRKLEQAVAASGRRSLTARSNQRGPLGRLWQEALDRGGYRVAGNVADRTAKSILSNPGKTRTLPAFFEELAHQSEDVLDEMLSGQGMAYGGIVPDDMAEFVRSKGGA